MMIDVLGLVIFMTIIGIGVLDVKSGLGPFDVYRSAVATRGRRRPTGNGHHGPDNPGRPSRRTTG